MSEDRAAIEANLASQGEFSIAVSNCSHPKTALQSVEEVLREMPPNTMHFRIILKMKLPMSCRDPRCQDPTGRAP